MSGVSRKSNWEDVYSTKGEREVSWFQETPAPLLELIALAGLSEGASIIDIGGGASRLVDALVERNVGRVTVLDLSAAALDAVKERLGSKAAAVQWVVADITTWEPTQTYDPWHDRTAFHFLTDPVDQSAYVERLKKTVKRGGRVIIGTFALDGPERCSGLQIVRHYAASLSAILGSDFKLIDT
jgi:trans-aconitate methyltransferase